MAAIFITCSNDVKQECDPSSETESSIKIKIIGNWRLETIQSGWSGNVTKPDSNTALKSSDGQAFNIYVGAVKKDSFNLDITKGGNSMQYVNKDTSRLPDIIQINQGVISVCQNELIIDNTELDGPKYFFRKVE
jgi:hypothetical protein